MPVRLDPRNFSLAEWQQAKRAGRDSGALKATVRECWAVSDSRASFQAAMEERGLYLAKSDRRAHVAVTYEGEVLSVARTIGMNTRIVASKLGKADDLRSVADPDHLDLALTAHVEGIDVDQIISRIERHGAGTLSRPRRKVRACRNQG